MFRMTTAEFIFRLPRNSSSNHVVPNNLLLTANIHSPRYSWIPRNSVVRFAPFRNHCPAMTDQFAREEIVPSDVMVAGRPAGGLSDARACRRRIMPIEIRQLTIRSLIRRKSSRAWKFACLSFELYDSFLFLFLDRWLDTRPARMPGVLSRLDCGFYSWTRFTDRE